METSYNYDAELQAFIKEKQKESRSEGFLEGWQQGFLEGWQQGFLEGKQLGLLQSKLESEQTIITNMLIKGLDATYIHEITDIPIERIENLVDINFN